MTRRLGTADASVVKTAQLGSKFLRLPSDTLRVVDILEFSDTPAGSVARRAPKGLRKVSPHPLPTGRTPSCTRRAPFLGKDLDSVTTH